MDTLEQLKVKQKELQRKIDQLHIRQFSLKILINRAYGFFQNKHAPLGDSEIAESITLTGQAIIKQSHELARKFIAEKTETTYEAVLSDDPVVLSDTDSVYIRIKSIIDKQGISFVDKKGKVTKDVYKLAEELEKYLNTNIEAWSRKELNSQDPRFVFKREAIADILLPVAKKRYVIHKLDDENVPCSKFKYVGLEVVRTAMPKKIKPLIKDLIEHMLITRNYTSTNQKFNELYKTFCEMELEQVAFTMGIKGYDKYASRCSGFNTVKSMPIHVKSAYFYNKLLVDLKITGKYEAINTGDKVRYIYVQTPNKLGIHSIGFKYQFPVEFKEFIKPDHEKLFEKIVSAPVERLYNAVNWKFYMPGSQLKVNLIDIFS